MPAQQSSYNLNYVRQGLPGQPGESRDRVVRAKRNDLAANAEAVYGRAYSQGAAADTEGFQLCVPGAAFLGVLLLSQHKEEASPSAGLLNGLFGNIIRKGAVWVTVVQAVTLNSVVKVFASDHSGTLAGAFQGTFGGSAVATRTATLLNARYLTAQATPGQTALLELDANSVLLTLD